MNTITSGVARPLEVKIDPYIKDVCYLCKRTFSLRRSHTYRDRNGNMICSFACLQKIFQAHNPAGA